jgi:hypothetical protein
VITELSRPGYEIVMNDLRVDKMVYVDRTYVFKDPIPSTLYKKTYIRGANNDKDLTSPTQFLTFRANQGVRIYVALDERIASPPSWLSGWRRHSERLVATDDGSDIGRVLYSRMFPDGSVVLGPNREAGMATGRNLYTAVIVPEVAAAQDWEVYQ